jgi:hypothetical protein
LSASKKKIKIQLEDAEGGKYNLSLEGNVSKEKIMKVFELMDLINLDGKSNSGYNDDREIQNKSLASVGSKIWGIIEHKFPYSTFTSSDILEIYEDEYNEPIQLSIISTYLSRYSDRGRLGRSRKGKEWIYKITRPSQVIESQSNQHESQIHHIQSRHLSHDVPSTVYDLHQ